MIEKTFEAEDSTLDDVTSFLEEELEKMNCPMKLMMHLSMVLEEIFINISHYAYPGKHGTVRISIDSEDANERVIICFIDSGVPFNPLEKKDPDVEASAEDRDIGGLGIFLTKKIVDDISYEYRDGQNMLKFTKKLF